MENTAPEAPKTPSLDERLANIERDVKKIKHRVTAMVVGNYLHFALILGSLILAAVLLPPLLGDVWSQYSELLQGSAAGSSGGRPSQDQIDAWLKQLNR